MRKYLLSQKLSVLLPVILIWSLNTSAQKVEHVILISLDGSMPEFYMDESWPAPNLQKLKSEGVYASKGAKSAFPSLTYPSHTSIITGANPIHHGIYYNTPRGGKPGEWYWYESEIKTKTLWDAVREAGLTSGAVFWPVSNGAPIDYNFPVKRPEKGEEGGKIDATRPYITPNGLLEEIEQKVGKKITDKDLAHKDFNEGKTIATIANYIIREYKPNLMAIHFVDIDHAQHRTGTGSAMVKQSVHVIDSLVGTVIQAVRDAGIERTTAFIITGDHGHANAVASFSPNVYLEQHGLIKRARFRVAGGSAFLYLQDENDIEAVTSVVSILQGTEEYRKGYFSILNRKRMDEMGANPITSLALAAKEGITLTGATKGETYKEKQPPYRSGHGYDPSYRSMHTTFIAVGVGIDKHKDIKTIELVDIAPLITKLLGISMQVPDGKLVNGIVK